MATIDVPLSERHVPTGALAGAVAAGAVLIVALRVTGVTQDASVETFVLIFTSIVVEALPFVLLGALVSALIEVYVSDRAFEAVARFPLPFQLPGAALGGLLFPVCECGSVPVARRLIARGMHPAAGIAFMLAAPILNPVVLASTWVAYGGRGLGLQMVAARAVLGLILATVAGWAIGGDGGAELLRSPRGGAAAASGEMDAAGSKSLVRHLSADFFFMGRFVVIGAALAAALQTVIPQGIVGGIARTPVVGSLALMGIAYVLSLCSEADAFVAVSLTPFPLGSQLAFLVFGPVVDVKLSFLYGATFQRNFVARLVLLAVPVVLAGSLWFEALVA